MKKFLFLKIVVIFIILLSLNGGVSAQTGIFTEGDMVINAGVGIGTYINNDNNDYTFSMIVPPITGSFEYGLFKMFDDHAGIGIGGYAGCVVFKGKDRLNLGNNFNLADIIIGPRVLFHYQFVDNLDTYAGGMIGWDVKNSQASNVPGSRPCFALFVGARYYITSNIGFFGELGYGVSPLQLGLCYKF